MFKFSKSVVISLLLLALLQLGQAQEEELVLTEEQVKSSIQKAATIYICSLDPLLDSARIESRRCLIGASVFADSC